MWEFLYLGLFCIFWFALIYANDIFELLNKIVDRHK